MSAYRVLLAALLLSLSVTTAGAAEPMTAEQLREKARAGLARLDGEIVVPGLKERVEVLRKEADAAGTCGHEGPQSLNGPKCLVAASSEAS